MLVVVLELVMVMELVMMDLELEFVMVRNG